MDGKQVLAYYSIRSKQNYIYRSNKIKEIVGASALIRDAFSFFKDHGRIQGDDVSFNTARIKGSFADDSIDGVILNEGGGNIYVLYKDVETCKKFNRHFSKWLFDTTHALTPLCAFIEVDIDANDYKGDMRALLKEVGRHKAMDEPLEAVNTLPFTMMNRNTMQPFSIRTDGEELTAEAHAKIKKYETLPGDDQTQVTILDKLVTEKGVESLLAVVHADGNNMGKRVEEALEKLQGYDDSVKAMRELSGKIDKQFVGNGVEAIRKKLDALKKGDPENEHIYAWRLIIGSGDEITFVCNARVAAELAKTYLRTVNNSEYSASCGIAVFHSHYPFSEAYAIAEQACASAKDGGKKAIQKIGNDKLEASFIDFEYIHGGVADKLSVAREKHADKIERPYCIQLIDRNRDAEDRTEELCKTSGCASLGTLYELAEIMAVAHSSIKELGRASFFCDGSERLAFERIVSRYPGLKERILATVPEDKLYRMLYDMSEFYDLWFDKGTRGDIK